MPWKSWRKFSSRSKQSRKCTCENKYDIKEILPVEEYGMWQLFLFYFSYLGFLHFGWEDGIYLRYAGKSFDKLDPKIFSGQFYGTIILQLIWTILGILLTFVLFDNVAKRTAFICAISLAVFCNFNNLCNFIMQITDRIKDYAKLIFTERVLLITFILFWLLNGYRSFPYMFLSKAGFRNGSGYHQCLSLPAVIKTIVWQCLERFA